MNNVTLRQLRYFHILSREGHFGRAAEAAAISQPALSMQIRELEENLGIQLFERTARRVRLTGFGEAFATRVEGVLQSVDELEEMARTSTGRLAGRFRMGIIPTIAPYLLPDIMASLNRALPDLDLNIRESQTARLIDELIAGKLDMALVALPVSQASLHEEKLFEEEFVLVRSKSDEHLPVPPADELREMRLLLLEEGHCFREQALAFCSLQSIRPREMLDGSSLSTLVQLVSSGLGITLIPEMAIKVETRSAPVSTARFPKPAPSRSIGMVWRKTSPMAADYMRIADLVRQALGH